MKRDDREALFVFGLLVTVMLILAFGLPVFAYYLTHTLGPWWNYWLK